MSLDRINKKSNLPSQIRFARRSLFAVSPRVVPNRPSESLSSLNDEPHTLITYGELKHASFIALEPACDSRGNVILSREDWWKTRSNRSTPNKTDSSARSSPAIHSRTCSSSRLASFSISPLSRSSSSGVFEDDDPFKSGSGFPPMDTTYEAGSGGYSTYHEGSPKKNPLSTPYISSRLASSMSGKNWDYKPGSSSGGPYGPHYGPTFPGDKGDKGNKRSKIEIKADLSSPTPKTRTGHSSLALDCLLPITADSSL